MKLFIVSATILCYLCLTFVSNSSVLKSGLASPTVQEHNVAKDEYKLSTDAKKDAPKATAVPFSHVNHSTKKYSADGTKPIACVECHHTDQPAAEAAKTPPYKTAYPADRTVTLTAANAANPQTPDVVTCRSCHAQAGVKPMLLDAIPTVTYEGDTDATVLDNEIAYHNNCNGCHDKAVELRKDLKIPTGRECIKCHIGGSTSGGNSFQRFGTSQQRVEEIEAERRARISRQVDQAAKAARQELARHVKELTVTSVPNPDRARAVQNVEAYEAQAVSNALSNTKAILLQGLPRGRQLEGLRAYVERTFPISLQLSVFRNDQNTFVERNAANEVLAKAEETIETVDISDAEVEITITSLPDDATFKLLSFDGKAIQDVCTNDCSVRLYRGDYKYEIARVGYKKKRFDLFLLNRAPRLKLGCRMVKVGEDSEPSPCRESVVSEH